MRRLAIFLSLLMPAIPLFAQKDAEAVKILDRFSARALAAPSVSMKFDLITTDQTDGTTKTDEGSIILKKDKYRLDLPDNIIWFDGETSWNYLPDEKEVTITKPEKSDDSFQTRPSSIFTIYRKGYKIRLVEDRTNSYLIDLYPEDINSDNIRIRLDIQKPDLNLNSLEYKYRNGITVTVRAKEYNLKQKPEDSTFVFSPDKYKGVEINDMR